nr:uncharacterized protein LOC111510715 [Leptinotarsa decemlineata]XP_023022423.1 uncharacterized protein LOC111510715 [Leptinotarsa decemlineata]
MDYSEDINSVDLTEDEDSRGTIVNSEVDNVEPSLSGCSELFTGDSFYHRVSAYSPPPLTPIPRLTPVGKLPTDYLPTVPKLTKIRRQSSISQKSPPKKGVTLISSTLVKPAINGSSIIIDSDDEDVPIVQSETENFKCQNTTAAMPGENRSAASSKQPGKLVVIKKNNKLYKIVIPHNVMPTTNQLGGPVLINIPEVGPLVIRIDPKSKNLVTPNSSQLEPFSLNFDDIMNKVSSDSVSHQKNFSRHPPNISRVKPKGSCILPTNKWTLLSDPKFCWSYTRIKQRDQDFFLNTDKLGFSTTELRKSRRCRRILDSVVAKKEAEVKRMMDSFEKLKERVDESHLFKPVKISEIVGHSSDYRKIAETGSVGPHNIENVRLPPNTLITHLTEYDDLLMTRKIVILNKGHTESSESNASQLKKIARMERNFRYRQKKKKLQLTKMLSCVSSKDYKNLIKPCYVKMTREDYIDQMINPQNTDNSNKSMRKGKKLSPRRSNSNYIQHVIDIFMSKLIDTEDKFKREMAFIKPVLVVNEFNFNIVKYMMEFSKSNIVVAVNELRTFPQVFLENQEFSKAVECGYVKLVDSEILCRYLVGNLGPQSPSKMDM